MPVTIDGTTGVTTPGATVGAITGILKATSGVVSQAVAGSDYGQLTIATAQTATGTAVDFTGIPSWVKRITVMLNAVSTNGSSFLALRVGTSSGVATTGYAGGAGEIYPVNNILTNGSVTEIALQASASAVSDTYNGVVTIVNLSGNIWSYAGNIYRSAATSRSATTAGTVTLSAILDRVRLTTTSVTDTFDAGTINISYE
jgi:hypothetical protein